MYAIAIYSIKVWSGWSSNLITLSTLKTIERCSNVNRSDRTTCGFTCQRMGNENPSNEIYGVGSMKVVVKLFTGIWNVLSNVDVLTVIINFFKKRAKKLAIPAIEGIIKSSRGKWFPSHLSPTGAGATNWISKKH